MLNRNTNAQNKINMFISQFTYKLTIRSLRPLTVDRDGMRKLKVDLGAPKFGQFKIYFYI